MTGHTDTLDRRPLDRRETVLVFQQRLAEVITNAGISRSAFAGRLGIDRSTLSQLLAPGNVRLPRAETIAAIAASEQVSVDWLLGLSQVGQIKTDILSRALEMKATEGTPADKLLGRWHAEAAGYKIRYVPTTVPDMLRTEDTIRYEYRQYGAEIPENRIEQAEAQLIYTRRPETDVEICSSVQSITGFARGEGVWRDLSLQCRREQLAWMIELLDEIYPTLRWFLFDGRQRYSVPLTVFGPQRVAVYLGNMYLVLNSTEHVRELTTHFDDLIRAAVIQPPDVAPFLKGLLRDQESETRRGT